MPLSSSAFPPENPNLIRAEIAILERNGIIRKASSVWAANALPIRKADGTLHLCVDNRKLNKLVVSVSGSLGDMQEIFNNCAENTYFSTLDLTLGFNQLRIAEADKHKASFRDARGQLLEMNRAGFGLEALPSAFTTAAVEVPIRPLRKRGIRNWLHDRFTFS